MTDHQKDVDEVSGVETTGHEWDGIKELNNPLPRWWLYIFYASIVWAVVYMVLMPAWPSLPGMGGTHTPGVRGHSDRVNVAAELEQLKSERAGLGQRLVNASLESIVSDQNLLQFAMASGESAFGDNCATCHGAGGRGFSGYPALVDDVWLWGGSLDDIQHTINWGIRQENLDSRFSLMPAFGRDDLLDDGTISDLAHYVRAFSGLEGVDREAAARATETYEAQCSTCHGLDGSGDRTQGAPNLTDREWLYGSDHRVVYETIYNARNSQMPAWNERLDEPTIKALAVYVHSLGGGE